MSVVVKKVKKKRLNVARTLVFILFIYLVVCLGLYVYNEPVRHYEINGITNISDAYVLRKAELVDYPPFVSLNLKEIEKKLREDPFIEDVKVSYNWNFQIDIKIEESIPVFFVRSENKVCLSDGTLVDNNGTYAGIPTLLNDTPELVRTSLASNLKKVDPGILYMISEIEYTPKYSEAGKPIDDSRFLFYMNDKLLVYITANKTTRMNDYLSIIASVSVSPGGTLNLDSLVEGVYPYKEAGVDKNEDEL